MRDNARRYGDLIGPPATRTGEPGQARKGAAVVRDVGAGVLAGEVATQILQKRDSCASLFVRSLRSLFVRFAFRERRYSLFDRFACRYTKKQTH